MATLFILIGLVLLGLLALLSVIAYVQSRRHIEADSSTHQHRLGPTKAAENEAKGQRAEAFVRDYRLGPLSDSLYTKYHSIYIPRHDGSRTTEVDHILVSPFGIFVIETKSWPGTIRGASGDSQWCQELGRDLVHKHANPLKQNSLHVRSLAKFLDLPRSALHSIVCFQGEDCVFGNPMPDSVVHDADLHAHITSFRKQILNAEGVAEADRALRELVDGPDHERYRKAHHQEIARRRGEATSL